MDSSDITNFWKAAIGLQSVDELKPSSYLIEIAKSHIKGDMDINQAEHLIETYHEAHDNHDEMEADIVALRIVKILEYGSFCLSPKELRRIHGILFSGVYDHAGKYRECDIRKSEPVLGGESVLYSPHGMIADILAYDFNEEEKFSYDGDPAEVSHHIASFISGLWQIHPFAEGNTRTIAVFLLGYLNRLGISADYDVFGDHSKYFRNALVRANYQNRKCGIVRTDEFLELFFDSLLFGARHELGNRNMHVDYESE